MSRLQELVEREARNIDASLKGSNHVSEEQIAAQVEQRARWLVGASQASILEDIREAITDAMDTKAKASGHDGDHG